MTYKENYGTIGLKGGDWMEDELGRRILEYRAAHDMSQEEFAIKARLNVMTVNMIENGRRIPTKLTKMKIEQIIKEDKKDEIQG